MSAALSALGSPMEANVEDPSMENIDGLRHGLASTIFE
jgi:hypothetical protein